MHFGWGNKFFPEFYTCKKPPFVALLDLNSVRRSTHSPVCRWHSSKLFLPFLSGPPCVIRKCGTTPTLLQSYQLQKCLPRSVSFDSEKSTSLWSSTLTNTEHTLCFHYETAAINSYPVSACRCPQPRRAPRSTHVWINVRLDGFTSRRHTVSQDDCVRSRISGWTVAILCARQAYAVLHSCSFTWAYVLQWWNSGLLKFTGPGRSGGGRSQTAISHKQEIFPSIRAPLS